MSNKIAGLYAYFMRLSSIYNKQNNLSKTSYIHKKDYI